MLFVLMLLLAGVAFLFFGVKGLIGVVVAVVLIIALTRHGMREHPGHTEEGPYDPTNSY